VTITEVLPDDARLRLGRRERILSEMEAADVDVLVLGREANARYVSGAPRLWTAGSRAFGPGCVLVRATGAIYLLSTWDEGVPDDIPRDHLYGISFNPARLLQVLKGIDGASTARTVATDALTPGAAQMFPEAFPVADLVDGEQLMRRARTVKTPLEVEAIRRSIGIAERSLAAALAALEPGVTERRLTGVFMEAMAAAGVTTPSTQDVAWIMSRNGSWHPARRDVPVAAGDLVAFDAGVVAGGYVGELGRTATVGGGPRPRTLFARCEALWDRLVHACRPGEHLAGLLDAYDAEAVPPPPMPVAHGLGLGDDLPLATHLLRRTASDQHLEVGMVVALTAFVSEPGVGAVYCQEPVAVTPGGPELLATTPFFATEARS
jgi:Xaa-Pro aminopeptidase